MFEALAADVRLVLGQSYPVALLASFVWGILSVLHSPCHLSGIPLVIGYIGQHGKIKAARTRLLALFFALGSLLSVALVGVVSVGMGQLVEDAELFGDGLLGLLFLFAALYLLDVVHLHWGGLVPADEQRGGLWGALGLGFFFGIGHGPCTVAFLAPVLGAAFSMAGRGWLQASLPVVLFGLGHAALIVAAGSMTGFVQRYIDWSGRSPVPGRMKRIVAVLLLISALYQFVVVVSALR